MKILSLSLLAICLASGVRADVIKQSATYNRDILVTDSTGANVTGKVSANFTVLASKAGSAYATVTPTITEKANGHYNVAYPTTLTDTVGSLSLVITVAGAVQTDVGDQVYDFLPTDIMTRIGANGAGLTSLGDARLAFLDTAISGVPTSVWGATTRQLTATQAFNNTGSWTGNLTGNVSGSVGSVTGSVGSVTSGVTLAAGQNVATIGGLAPPVRWNLMTVDGSGYVTFANTSIGSVTGSVGSVTGFVSINLAQALDTSHMTDDTIGGGLFGGAAYLRKVVITGNSLTIYQANGTTPIKSFTLTPSPTAGTKQ